MEALIKFRRIALRLIAWILYYSGIISLLRIILNKIVDKKRKAIILLYHRITDEVDFITKGMGGKHTSIVNFEKQIRFLKKNFQLVTLEGLAFLLRTKDRDSATYLAITFDDGFRDVYSNALPILKEYKVPATIFLMTDYVNAHKLMWRHKQYYYDYYKENINETAENNLANKLYLNWDELKLMQENGIDIGAHTRSHFTLSQMPSDQVRRQIQDSKNKVEEFLGSKVNTFAYPFGKKKDFNKEIKEVVKGEGFILACSAIEGINFSTSDIYALKRISLGNQSVSSLAMKLLFYELLT